MNREIKFRAWDGKHMHPDVSPWRWDFVISNSWHRCEKSTGSGLLGSGGEYAEMLVPAVRFKELMQYTGLKDKNGKEIYEGDIGKVHHGDPFAPETLVFVVFENGSFGVYPLENQTDIFGNKYTGKILCFSDGYNKESFEIIGNIYENSDIL